MDVIKGPENADRLYNNFIDSVSNLRITNIIHLQNNMQFIENKVAVTGLMISTIQEIFDDRIAAMLREWFESYELTPETLSSDIISIEAECEMMMADYKLYLSELEKLTGINTGEEQTIQQRYQYYADLMKEVCKMPNVGFLPADMDTQRWASYIKDYFNLIDQKKLSSNGKSGSN